MKHFLNICDSHVLVKILPSPAVRRRALKKSQGVMVVSTKVQTPFKDVPVPQDTLQFSSAQSYPTLCDPMNRSTPGLPVHHQLLEFTQTHVHRVRDAI